ncbi:hypothetical protein [Pseudonocardia sp. HH130630-07]|uniref:hypothetical protein n=1 Tax=Pseudonocardia sp. HH130630-07 TaxID=1690815 RepID=UPI0008151676|nr:hypothetical protein [Pseudonocardia sp. HH130630-07]ANY08025.1 hypothetical protein AFB00_18925 [Pseudonocardia sp. HH130630-07]
MSDHTSTGALQAIRAEAWRVHAERMAAELVSAGCIRDRRWYEAFANTPRHLLLPGIDARGVDGDDVPEQWLTAVYSAAPPTGADDESPPWPVVPPSEPTPAELAALLDLLHPADAEIELPRVLEVGAGCGYVTALLCHRFGAEQVTATDPHSADYTRALLAGLDLFPCLVTARDPRGAAAYGPFDAILCTTGDPSTPPPTWLPQLGDSGRMIAVVRGADSQLAAEAYQRLQAGPVHSRILYLGTRPPLS